MNINMKKNEPINKLAKRALSTIAKTISSSNLSNNPILQDMASLIKNKVTLESNKSNDGKNKVKKTKIPKPSLSEVQVFSGREEQKKRYSTSYLPTETINIFMDERKTRTNSIKKPLVTNVNLNTPKNKGIEL